MNCYHINELTKIDKQCKTNPIGTLFCYIVIHYLGSDWTCSLSRAATMARISGTSSSVAILWKEIGFNEFLVSALNQGGN